MLYQLSYEALLEAGQERAESNFIYSLYIKKGLVLVLENSAAATGVVKCNTDNPGSGFSSGEGEKGLVGEAYNHICIYSWFSCDRRDVTSKSS